MKMNAADIKKYPKFAHYVKADIPTVVHVAAIMHAMNRVGQINKVRLQSALRWGNPPNIRIVPLARAYGEFTPNVSSNEIRLSRRLVQEFEAGKGKRSVRAGKAYLVGITLLHELVHWGDDQDGVDRIGEEGEEFERLMYGAVVY